MLSRYSGISQIREESKEKLTDKAPLIREQFNGNNPFTLNAPRFLSEPTIGYIIADIVKRSGIYNQCKKEVSTSHGMRKFFMTECERSGMKSINVKMLLGHDIGVSGHYYRPPESDILADYMTHAADALTIDPTKRLEKENEDLKTIRAEEIEKLKSRLDAAEERNKRIEKTADEAFRFSKTLLEDFESFIKTGRHKPGVRYDFT